MKHIHESRMFRHRGWVGVVCLVPIAICVILTKPLVEEETVLDFILESIGWVLFIVYAVFRIWATLFVGGRKDAVLQTEGPYSITRNPLYFGSFCFALSIAFFLDSVMLIALTVLGTVVYIGWIVRAEETLLAERFGADFLRYKQETPMFIPRLSSYRSPESLEVNLQAIKTELKRLLFACVVPLTADSLAHLRSLPHWPHWFWLP